MVWLLASLATAADIPIAQPKQGFKTMRLNLGGFTQPRFGYTPDDDDIRVKGNVGFAKIQNKAFVKAMIF